MINSGASDFKFTDEQTLQLNEWQRRISEKTELVRSLDEEIEAKKVQRKELEKALDYEDSRISAAQTEVLRLTNIKATLVADIDASTQIHKAQGKELQEAKDQHAQTEANLDRRDKAIMLREEALHQHQAELDAEAQRLNEEKLEVEKAKDTFLEAVKAVSWK